MPTLVSRRLGFAVFVRLSRLAAGILIATAPLTAGAQTAPLTSRTDSQPRTSAAHKMPVPSARAVRRSGPIAIDGKLDEAAWKDATPVTDFTQIDPDMGKPASQRT
jgi:hypothetical protein